MTAAATLVGVGIPAEVASRIGFTVSAKTGVGTAQSGSTPITQNLTVCTTSSGQTAFQLPLNVVAAGPLVLTNPSATTALIYGQTGDTIDGGSANASVSIAQNKTRLFWRTGLTSWVSVLTA